MPRPTNPGTELSDELVALFGVAKRAAAQRIRSLGWRLTMPTEVWYANRDHDDSSGHTVGKKQVMQNALVDPDFSLREAAPLLNREASLLAERCAAQIS